MVCSLCMILARSLTLCVSLFSLSLFLYPLSTPADPSSLALTMGGLMVSLITVRPPLMGEYTSFFLLLRRGQDDGDMPDLGGGKICFPKFIMLS